MTGGPSRRSPQAALAPQLPRPLANALGETSSEHGKGAPAGHKDHPTQRRVLPDALGWADLLLPQNHPDGTDIFSLGYMPLLLPQHCQMEQTSHYKPIAFAAGKKKSPNPSTLGQTPPKVKSMSLLAHPYPNAGPISPLSPYPSQRVTNIPIAATTHSPKRGKTPTPNVGPNAPNCPPKLDKSA